MLVIPNWFKLFEHQPTDLEVIPMNRKSLQYNTAEISNFETVISRQISNISTMFKKVKEFIVRFRIEQVPADYQMKRKLEAQKQNHQGTLKGLPLEEKLRLGMYHFMD
jgi:hypothetical protein